MDWASALVTATWVSESLWATGLVALSCTRGIWLRYPRLLLLPIVGVGLVSCALIEQIGEGLSCQESREWILDYILEWAGVPEDEAELEA